MSAASGADAEAEFEAKRCRRLGQLLAEYGDDANLIEAVDVVIAGGVTFRVNPLLLAQTGNKGNVICYLTNLSRTRSARRRGSRRRRPRSPPR